MYFSLSAGEENIASTEQLTADEDSNITERLSQDSLDFEYGVYLIVFIKFIVLLKLNRMLWQNYLYDTVIVCLTFNSSLNLELR